MLGLENPGHSGPALRDGSGANDPTGVPTANPKRLTATANRLILAPDERSLQVDLVRLDRTLPVAGCIERRPRQLRRGSLSR
jgi:hypothetical protein